MISGWYIVQPKRTGSNAHDYDVLNILVGPYPSEATCVMAGPAFDTDFRKKYPGERAPLTVMHLSGYSLPEGRFNAEWGFNPNAPFALGFPVV